MDRIPELQCAYEEQDGRRKKAYLTVLILGLLIFLATCVVVSIQHI